MPRTVHGRGANTLSKEGSQEEEEEDEEVEADDRGGLSGERSEG